MIRTFDFTASSAWPRTVSFKRCLGYSIVLTIFSLVVFRAGHQSISHDEAVTYNLFASQGLPTIFLTFHSNNHTLNTFLMWLSTSIFGLSVFSVRMPALLGAVIYLTSTERICNLSFKNSAYYALALLALATSPFLLDYLTIARGYSLALGLLMLALFFVWKQVSTRPERTVYHEGLISILAALSVSANLSFAFVNMALLLAYALLLAVHYYQKELSARQLALKVLLLAVPGALLYCIITPSIQNFSADTLYFGTGSWHRTFDTLTTELFDGYRPALLPVNWQELAGNVARYLPYCFILLIIAAVFVLLPKTIQYVFSNAPLEPAEALWVLVALNLSITVLLLSAARLFFGVLLPRERTGIYFVPLFLLLACLSIASFQKPGLQKALRAIGQFCLVVTVLYFGLAVRVNSFRETLYDSGTEATFQVLLRTLKEYPGARVAANWVFEPSLNFYRTMYKVEGLNRFTRRAVYADYRLLILLPSDDGDRQYIDSHDVRVLYTNPDSGAVLVLNPVSP